MRTNRFIFQMQMCNLSHWACSGSSSWLGSCLRSGTLSLLGLFRLFGFLGFLGFLLVSSSGSDSSLLSRSGSWSDRACTCTGGTIFALTSLLAVGGSHSTSTSSNTRTSSPSSSSPSSSSPSSSSPSSSTPSYSSRQTRNLCRRHDLPRLPAVPCHNRIHRYSPLIRRWRS
ncbi:hypothetical protein BC830DRAFT_120240, partial [Chytriomyces sp. MP71]